MTDTCGLTSCEPFAKWDRDSQSWKTSEATSLWALTLSSLTLPAWGGLHDGELCEHPTPELHTSALDSSSLPTPNAADGKRNNLTHQPGEGNPTLLGAVHHLPTPRTSDSNGAGGHGSGGPDLRTTISMLPTPRAQDEYERRNMKTMERIRDEGGDMTLPTWAKVVAPLLPTPSVADATGGHATRSGDRSGELLLPGLVKTFLPTPTSQAAKHGELSPVEREGNRPQDRGNLWVVMPRLVGETTAQPSPAGSASSDDPHQHQLSLDGLAHPA